MAVKHGILGILVRGPQYGYEIKAAFDRLTANLWELNIGQVYSTLERLLKEGLVALAAEDEERKFYRITPAGEAALSDWLQRSPSKTRPLRDEVFVRIGLLIESRPAEALALVQSQWRLYHLQLAALTREKLAATSLSERLLLDGALLHTEADLKWLELCKEKLAGGGVND